MAKILFFNDKLRTLNIYIQICRAEKFKILKIVFFCLFVHSVIFKNESEDTFKKEERNKEDEGFDKKGKPCRDKRGS